MWYANINRTGQVQPAPQNPKYPYALRSILLYENNIQGEPTECSDTRYFGNSSSNNTAHDAYILLIFNDAFSAEHVCHFIEG